MRRRASASRTERALRGALVALVVAGYVLALGTTASGEGLKLLPHLALEHAPTAPAAPHLVGDQEGDRDVLRTLRPKAHAHDDHKHRHASDPVRETIHVLATPPEARGLHEHEGAVHRHDTAPTEQHVVVTVSLDKHRLPATPGVPAPAVAAVPLGGERMAPPASVDPSVETPPPIRRG
ncbi:hypothetical protein [Rubrivirga marina]|uniref:Uncharacterized protein n=1 Tax=Rubrivirga marina TaxID=1196024 RepID=A0A271IW86_9BACT|nr:hypothetical protein [Rubrivirga marina]PAP75501.1 hypothetical protein BSZ37_03095 [Rubrivirga marina]